MPEAVRRVPAASEPAGDTTEVARRMIAARRALHGPLPSGILHDTALDILLRLFVARGRPLGVAELVSDLPSALHVADRWLAVLEHDALIETQRGGVVLSVGGHAAMRDALGAVVHSQTDSFAGP